MRNYYYDNTITYEINHLLCIAILARGFILLKIILNLTSYRSPRAYRLRYKLYKKKLKILFYNKAEFMVQNIHICLH